MLIGSQKCEASTEPGLRLAELHLPEVKEGLVVCRLQPEWKEPRVSSQLDKLPCGLALEAQAWHACPQNNSLQHGVSLASRPLPTCSLWKNSLGPPSFTEERSGDLVGAEQSCKSSSACWKQ